MLSGSIRLSVSSQHTRYFMNTGIFIEVPNHSSRYIGVHPLLNHQMSVCSRSHLREMRNNENLMSLGNTG